ncbi:hypothetical protein [Aeropyrum camini]|uniref:Uncharacterized protein n=1 Tax=Aeropyrum camini SY1 = JCM 12091 TaxID=1198449 RepID=U3TB03_9CREN|nr:hypothetical protein [Aeropyrum camini]BAN90702.1 hypothetical protein ACAM_1233 [Aeropyrum camini SY1 = JCM 12091]
MAGITPVEVEALIDVVEDVILKLEKLKRRLGDQYSGQVNKWIFTFAYIREGLKSIAEKLEEGRYISASSEACEVERLVNARIISLDENDAIGSSLRGSLAAVRGFVSRLCGDRGRDV